MGDNWSFPKGKVNENEDGAACAAREVREETGYFPTALSDKSHFEVRICLLLNSFLFYYSCFLVIVIAAAVP